MTEAKRFEAWLKRAAASPEMRDLAAQADARPALSEQVLADYYAGLLTPDEQRLVQRQIALSDEASRFLATLDADVEAAAAQVSPKLPALVLLRHRIGAVAGRAMHAFDALTAPAVAVRVAASAAVLTIAILGGMRAFDRPPGDFGPAFDPSIVQRSPPGTFTLPDGTVLTGVNPEWQLRTPERHPHRVRWFSWDPVQGAASYTLELRGADGNVAYSRSGVARNTFRLPWSVRRALERNVDYIWIVTAVDAQSNPLVRAVGRFRME